MALAARNVDTGTTRIGCRRPRVLNRGRKLSQITELVARVVQVLRDLGDLDHPQRLPSLTRGTGEGRNQGVVTVSPPPLDDWASQGRTC
jgi:hypothetical protein